MAYLDYRAFEAFLARHAHELPAKADRTVGRNRRHDSGYDRIVRFFGLHAVDPNRVEVQYRAEPFSFDDPVIAEFARRIEAELRAAGRLYVGPQATAVVEEHMDSSAPWLLLAPADYGPFAGTCFALDTPDPCFGEHRTLREYAHRHRSNLPLCMGVCGLLVTTEPDTSRRLLTVRRAGHLASLTHSVGPSAAGSVDYRTGGSNLYQLLHESMNAEIAEELGLAVTEYTITPLAYAREPFRGGKPQLFCRIDTPLASNEILNRLARLTARPEFTDCLFFPLDNDNHLAAADIPRLNHEAAMNYFLLEEHSAGR